MGTGTVIGVGGMDVGGGAVDTITVKKIYC